eukprot:561994_1
MGSTVSNLALLSATLLMFAPLQANEVPDEDDLTAQARVFYDWNNVFDHNPELTFPEFHAWTSKDMNYDAEQSKWLFNHIDKDGSAGISFEELVALIQQMFQSNVYHPEK